MVELGILSESDANEDIDRFIESGQMCKHRGQHVWKAPADVVWGGVVYNRECSLCGHQQRREWVADDERQHVEIPVRLNLSQDEIRLLVDAGLVCDVIGHKYIESMWSVHYGGDPAKQCILCGQKMRQGWVDVERKDEHDG